MFDDTIPLTLLTRPFLFSFLCFYRYYWWMNGSSSSLDNPIVFSFFSSNLVTSRVLKLFLIVTSIFLQLRILCGVPFSFRSPPTNFHSLWWDITFQMRHYSNILSYNTVLFFRLSMTSKVQTVARNNIESNGSRASFRIFLY